MEGPQTNELVICKVVTVNPHSVIVKMLEYEKEGMIHISEIKRGWIRDIRKHVKLNETLVAKVLGIRDRNYSLSIKRVDEKQRNQKLKSYKLEQRAEKMFSLIPGRKNELKKKILEEYGSLYDGFRATLKNPEKARIVLGRLFDAVKDIAEKNIEIKEFILKGSLTLKTEKEGGIELIKNVLNDFEKAGLTVKYISAPKYMILYKTSDAKKGEKRLIEMIERGKKKHKDVSIDFKRS